MSTRAEEHAGERASELSKFRYTPWPSTESDLSRARSPGTSAFEDAQPMFHDYVRYWWNMN